MVLYVLLLFLTAGGSFVTIFGDAQNATFESDPGCNNHCSVDEDDGYACFNSTKTYYAGQTVKSLESLITVLIDIDQWKWRQKENGHENNHGFNYSDPTVLEPMVADLINQFKKFSSGNYINESVYEVIAREAFHQVAKESASKITAPPQTTCPIPCNYQHDLWTYLCVASLLVNAGLVLLVIPFIVRSERLQSKPLLGSAKKSGGVRT